MALLKDIQASSDHSRIVRTTPTKSAFRKGDIVEFTIESSHAGYLYLIMSGTDGETFDLLFPNRLDRNNLIPANQKISLPRASWEVTAEGPAGVNHILAIVSETPRDFSVIGLQPSGPFSTVPNTPMSAGDIMRTTESAQEALDPICQDALPASAAECSGRYSAQLFELKEID